MMRTFPRAVRFILILVMILGVSRVVAETSKPAGPEIIRSGVVLVDGSSSYLFSKDGKFTSAPLDLSGRTFEGKWEIIEGKTEGAATVVVTAKEGWRDGIQSENASRRIVFVIYPGVAVPYVRTDDPTGKIAIMCENPKSYFKCYWFIDEMTKIETPAGTKAEKAVPPSRP